MINNNKKSKIDEAYDAALARKPKSSVGRILGAVADGSVATAEAVVDIVHTVREVVGENGLQSHMADINDIWAYMLKGEVRNAIIDGVEDQLTSEHRLGTVAQKYNVAPEELNKLIEKFENLRV